MKLLLAALAAVAAADVSDVNEWPSIENDHTKLQIILPESLQIKGGYVHKDALFGYPGYSVGSLETQLIYLNTSACEDFPKGNWEPPFALMIDRGDCVFVEKVRRAQHAGARAVVVADNKCLCSDIACMRQTGDNFCETVLPFMNDDESGGDITIPSMLIRKSDADAIKKTISHSNGVSNVMVKFDWGIPSPDGRVEWTMWHSSWDEQSAITLKTTEDIVLALGDRAFFTPRFVAYNGSRVGCNVVDGLDPCGNMCINKGRYCLMDPSPFHDRMSGASGADVVIENLRRKCIWKLASTEDAGVGKKWWRYVNDFGDECNQKEETFMNKQCAVRIMKKHGIDAHAVEQCMQPYGRELDVVNEMLEADLKEQTALQLLRLPALFVDGVHARGRIDTSGILNMICAGYGTHDPPAICSCSDQNPLALLGCVKQGGALDASSIIQNGVSFTTLMVILTFAGIGVASAGYVYWKRSQRQMREQVRSILAEYMPLDDQSDELDGHMHPAAVAAAKSPRGYMPTNGFLMDDDQL
ncbi:hypothetical protein SPRG_11600 [Saprolegnia parasitica CBS 223.65]|uniref:Uncharacterized protein n=1 Tax=Saprolegnia parasitica (strain CBS 223.65) TaxID=695850 RepID=A0A067C9S6_SAPPC|nr:hypothetical protein SPRG_11600 [Saprolegnia parasitica CBS 223.65]KDO23286.1 hypothetical protein SPRG_11600 [Saprolegnia parasitica CBS 223.65]|eukprot:XP_012205940.1 hypothetical protein SPRG_11600 [Saprolegnia parasitica CBS 223.65]